MRRRIATTLYMAALVALPLGLTATPALADSDHTVVEQCSKLFGPSATGTITTKQKDDKVTISVHCNTHLPGPDPAVVLKCDSAPGAKGKLVFSPSGNIDGQCSFPLKSEGENNAEPE